MEAFKVSLDEAIKCQEEQYNICKRLDLYSLAYRYKRTVNNLKELKELREKKEQKHSKYLDEIAYRLPVREALECLAEESSELSQAALKYIRAKKLSKNPTPKTEEEAREDLLEEFQDVLITMRLVIDDETWDKIIDVQDSPKLSRWYNRLREVE